MRRLTVITVGILLLAAGCSESPADWAAAGSTTTALAPTTTTSPSPTAATAADPPATSSTVPATTTPPAPAPPPTPPNRFQVANAGLYPAEPLAGSGGASGSGCAPGADALPGGIWYGRILQTGSGSIEFDLACFYFGEIAWDIAAQAGEEAPNDYWIVNDNPLMRSVPVAAEAVVWSIPGDLSQDLVPLQFETEWPPDWERAYAECPGELCGVWLYVNDGVVDEIVEQYVP